jgi:hypothetical protein
VDTGSLDKDAPERELINTVLRQRRETGTETGAVDLNCSNDDLCDHVLRSRNGPNRSAHDHHHL